MVGLISRRAFIGSGAAAALLTAWSVAFGKSAVGTVPGVPGVGGRAGAGAVAAAGGNLVLDAGRGEASDPPALLTRSTFTPLLGTTLRMTGGGDDFEVVLEEINDLSPSAPGDENRFALVFRAPVGQAPTQGIRTFRHERTGDTGIFVAPVGRAVDGLNYEAVFNRS
jgi:hypothetical protein